MYSWLHNQSLHVASIQSSCIVQKIGQKVDEYKTKVSEQNVQKDIEYFVLMETAFKRLEQLTEAQKGKLDAPFLLQEKQPAPPVSMPKGELPFARPRLPSLKPGEPSVHLLYRASAAAVSHICSNNSCGV